MNDGLEAPLAGEATPLYSHVPQMVLGAFTRKIRRTTDALSARLLANVFVLIFAMLSVGTIILTPPMQTPDAIVHFDRAVGISYGELIGKTSGGDAGGYLPDGVARIANAFSSLPFNYSAKTNLHSYEQAQRASWSSPRVFMAFSATTARNPIDYLPGAVAIVIARIFSDRILVSYYMVEVANLLLFLLMAWWSLRQFNLNIGIPICMVLLLPMVVSLTSSPNPDGLLMGLSVVFGAAIYQLYQHRDSNDHLYISETGRWHSAQKYFAGDIGRFSIIAWVSLALISLDKPPYAILGLLLGLNYLVEREFKSYLWAVVLGIGSIGLIEVVWLAFGSRSGTNPTFPASANISPSRQGHYLIDHLVAFPPLIFNTFKIEGSFYWHAGVGILGWLDTPLPTWAYYGATIFILGSIVGLIFSSRLLLLPLLASGVATLIAVVAIVLTLYADWTPVGTAFAQGVQGRYFLPLLPILIVCIGLSPNDRRSLRLPGFAGVLIMAIGCEVALLVALLPRYWAIG